MFHAKAQRRKELGSVGIAHRLGLFIMEVEIEELIKEIEASFDGVPEYYFDYQEKSKCSRK